MAQDCSPWHYVRAFKCSSGDDDDDDELFSNKIYFLLFAVQVIKYSMHFEHLISLAGVIGI